MNNSKSMAQMMAACDKLADGLDELTFAPPISLVYNPFRYAKENYQAYLHKYAAGEKKIIFMGMNPGPWGMAQTGVPFGEVAAVRDWLKLKAPIGKPQVEHPKRPVEGLACKRSEVSGRRLWSLFAERFETAQAFFEDHFVMNYCPLMFMEESGRNLALDKLPALLAKPLHALCDRHLRIMIQALRPEWVIGIGVYADTRARGALSEKCRHGRILHPSPASPRANSGWAEKATAEMNALGAW